MKKSVHLFALLCLFSLVPARAAAADDFQPEPGFTALFNGRDLTGWGYTGAAAQSFDGLTISPDNRYEVKDGVIRVNERTPRMIQQMTTQIPLPANCVVRLEYRAHPLADSGVFVRGMQIQCRDYLAVGPYYDLLRHHVQDWNTMEITVKGASVYVSSNGEAIEPSFRVPATGALGLEGDLGVMEYRRIRVREISAGVPAAPAAAPAATTRPNLATLNRLVRVAVVGDDIAQPFPGDSGTPGRGGIQLPGVTARQLAGIKAIVAAPAPAAQEVTVARTAVATASLAAPGDLPAKLAALAAADLKLASERAELWAWFQASPQRLPAAAAAALGPQVNNAPAGGRGGGGLRVGREVPGGVLGPTGAPLQIGPPEDLAPRPDLASGLARALGPRWDIRNFGYPGATVQTGGENSIWDQAALAAALDFDADVVVFVFGANDSKPGNWRTAAAFESDYRALATVFAAGPVRPRLFFAQPPTAFTGAGGVDPKLIAGEIPARIGVLARALGGTVIDLPDAMKEAADLTLDGVHPDGEGAKRIAARVQAALAPLVGP